MSLLEPTPSLSAHPTHIVCHAALVAALASVPLLLPACVRNAQATLAARGSGCRSVGDSFVTYGRWGDGLAVAVWFDADEGGGCGSSTSDSTATYTGGASRLGGERVEWTCVTRNGSTGTVVIRGESYDLADGALFLVSVRDDPPSVRQLDRDLTLIDPVAGDLERLAAQVDDIAGFVGVTEPANW